MISFMKQIIDTFLNWVYALMPTSPFQLYIQNVSKLPYLSYLNWFIPVKTIIIIGNAWLLAIFLWYLYGIVLRWVKAIS